MCGMGMCVNKICLLGDYRTVHTITPSHPHTHTPSHPHTHTHLVVCRSLQFERVSKQLCPNGPGVQLPKRVQLLQVLLVVSHLIDRDLVT